MVKQHCVPLESSSEWKEALSGIKHSFGHTWENCHAMHLTTGLDTYLYCFESDDVQIVCPIAEREFGGHIDIVKPFGFSGFVGNGEVPDFKYHWKDFARQRNYVCGYLGLNPMFDYSSHFDQEEVYHYDNVYVLDLTLTADELWSNLSSNRKRQLKDWDKILPDLIVVKPKLTEFFLANYVEFFRRKGADEFYLFSPKTLSFLFSHDEILMVGAQNSGRIEAVSVFAYTADVGEYLFNVSLPDCKDHTAALLWYGISHMKSLQVPLFNLGGGRGGIAESKRRYGGMNLPLKCIKEVYDPDTYGKLCRRTNIDPNSETGYFPAYRIRGKT